MNETKSECLKSFHEVQQVCMMVEGWLHSVYHINIQAIPSVAQTRFLKAEAELHLTILRQYQIWFADAGEDARKIIEAVWEKVEFGASDEQLLDLKNQIQLLEHRATILREQAITIWEAAVSLQDKMTSNATVPGGISRQIKPI